MAHDLNDPADRARKRRGLPPKSAATKKAAKKSAAKKTSKKGAKS